MSGFFVIYIKTERINVDKYISSNSQQYFAFNVWSIESAKAVMDAAVQTSCAIILQTSMKAFERLDKEAFREYVKNYGRKKNVKAYLHLDHCKKIELIYEAVKCGWDSVMIDASEKSLGENIRITNEVIDIAKPERILVEAEIGQICGQEDEIFSIEKSIARTEDIKEFVKNTDIDMLAASVGTVHGLYKGNPDIHYDRIEQIAGITDIPFVIHGGTGLTDEVLLKLLSYKNVKKINISTDVKLAYRRGIEESFQNGAMESDGFDPLRVGKFIHDSIQDMAAGKLSLLRKD